MSSRPTQRFRLRRFPVRLAAASFAAVLAASVVGVGVVQADAPDPILASTAGTIVLNPDGSRTVTVRGGWTWPTHTSDCNFDRRAVGFAVDWFDPAQPGNHVTTLNGTSIDVGAAAANAYNPADNLVHASPVANDSVILSQWRGGCGTYSAADGHNSGTWGPISHTYSPAFFGQVTICAVTYDVHLATDGGAPNNQKEITAGGSSHNPDVSAEANTKTPLGNGCFETTIQPPPYTGGQTPSAPVAPCQAGLTALSTSGVRLIKVPAGS